MRQRFGLCEGGAPFIVALTLIVCLQSSPSDYRPEQMSFDGSLMACAMYGQAVAAEWA